MPLTPNRPPGRANRKALQFSADIVRLRQAGYTFSAIALALRDAGLTVSLTTIKREAARSPSPHRAGLEVSTASHRTLSTLPDVIRAEPAPPPPTSEARSGREIAEAFFAANPSNPLLSPKDKP